MQDRLWDKLTEYYNEVRTLDGDDTFHPSVLSNTKWKFFGMVELYAHAMELNTIEVLEKLNEKGTN